MKKNEIIWDYDWEEDDDLRFDYSDIRYYSISYNTNKECCNIVTALLLNGENTVKRVNDSGKFIFYSDIWCKVSNRYDCNKIKNYAGDISYDEFILWINSV